MKKVVKISVLLVVAAALFAGCKKDADESGYDDGVLFSKNDVSIAIDASDIEFSDGNWVATFNETHKGEASGVSLTNSQIERYEFTVSERGTELEVTRKITTLYTKGTYNGETKVSCMTEEADAYELQGYSLSSIRNKFWRIGNSGELKTNDAQNKFYGEADIGNSDPLLTFYAMKK